jgi:hypothetical protein
MKTHCNQKTFDFQSQNSRKIVAHFNGGNITSDAGATLPAVPHAKKRLKIRICEKCGLTLLGFNCKKVSIVPKTE